MARTGFMNFLGGAALALSLSTSSGAFASFEGFGKDIPLESAAKQIVPSDWSIDYGNGVDPKTPISWSSAGDWQSALRSAVAKKGLSAQFGSNTVIIAKDAGSTRPYSSAPRDAKPAAKPSKPLVSRPTTPAPQAKAEPAQGGGGFSIRPYRGAANAEASGSSSGLATKGDQNFEPYGAPVAVFTVSAGQMLRPVLSDWATSAGWRLIWESEYDYRIEADASFGSDFVKAVSDLATAMRSARPAITIDFFNGNNVVVVSNKSADSVN